MESLATASPRPKDKLCSRLENIIGSKFTSGNTVDLLQDGDEIFPAMLEAIKNAEVSIRFLTYVYWEGDIAEKFADAIAERAEAGVTCHVLLDAYGSKRMRPDVRGKMKEAGAHLALYNRFSIARIAEYQHRTHRKILVCDGDVGFIGGVGIADEWTGHAQDADHWHDYHFRITGPAVTGLAETFDDDWNSHRVLRATDDRPIPDHIDTDPIEPEEIQLEAESTATLEDMDVLPFYSTPHSKESEAFDAFMAMVEEAQESIRIITAYFIPQEKMLEALGDAAERGVDVEIIVPGGHCDSWLARRSSQAKWAYVLNRGVRIYEYTPTMCHAKAAIFDDSIVTVGSINFDLLSLCLNDEANIIVRSERFAAEMTRQWMDDKEKCTEITAEEWGERSVWNRIGERIAAKFPLPWWGSSSNYRSSTLLAPFKIQYLG